MVYLPAGRQARKSQKEMYYVYILQSLKTKEFYKGLTDNFDRRLNEHLKEKSNWAKNKLPLKLIHVEICTDRLEARKLEKFFKSGYGREIIEELAGVVEWQTRGSQKPVSFKLMRVRLPPPVQF